MAHLLEPEVAKRCCSQFKRQNMQHGQKRKDKERCQTNQRAPCIPLEERVPENPLRNPFSGDHISDLFPLFRSNAGRKNNKTKIENGSPLPKPSSATTAREPARHNPRQLNAREIRSANQVSQDSPQRNETQATLVNLSA